MRYTKFRIRNFKGIRDTTVDLQTIAGASVFAFVGLNESGKTTVLEAIHSFSPDSDTGEIVVGIGVPHEERVPRHQISSFTGDVSVEATAYMTDDEKIAAITALEKEHGIKVRPDSLPNEVIFERQQRFKGGDFVDSFFSLRNNPQVKAGSQRKWRDAEADERSKIKDELYSRTPDICYFPTFVFDFPQKVYLTDRGGKVDSFYRDVFQDILDYDGQGFKIQRDIVRRVRSTTMTAPWLDFLQKWSGHSDAEKIQHVMDRAGATISSVVFGRWNQIFRENAKGKEIIINFGVDEGERTNANKSIVKTQEHDLYVSFQIKDGTRRFDVNDRSLGFRWFFSFMLFTQFRAVRARTRPLLFLFDEPASNLHAAAQLKLIDCFPQIARNQHALIYTTHSHYMIEPKWLEQTFIVTNRADSPPDSILEAASLDDESLDVKVSTYRSFVNAHPNQTTYFQPILDRLDVVPSRFDIKARAVIVEGRSDYYILRYAIRLNGFSDLALMPGLGAGTFGGLAALNAGWNLRFLFLLDADKQGHAEKRRYTDDFGIEPDRVVTLRDLSPDYAVIEDLVVASALNIISSELGITGQPTKPQLKRFFQERLAADHITDLGAEFEAKSKSLLEALKSRLEA